MKLAYGGREDKAFSNKIVLKLVNNAVSLLLVRFLSADSLNIFGVCKDNGTIAF